MKIVLLGSPGAGKDTLANNMPQYTMISPGGILRAEAVNKTKLGLEAKNKYWGKGVLCPDSLINSMVADKLKSLNKIESENIIFNGYPRSLGQAKFLNNLIFIDLVICLDVSESVAINRLLKRGRNDDTINIINQRFNEYKEKTMPISNYYGLQSGSRTIFIDTDEPADVVNREIIDIMKDMYI